MNQKQAAFQRLVKGLLPHPLKIVKFYWGEGKIGFLTDYWCTKRRFTHLQVSGPSLSVQLERLLELFGEVAHILPAPVDIIRVATRVRCFRLQSMLIWCPCWGWYCWWLSWRWRWCSTCWSWSRQWRRRILEQEAQAQTQKLGYAATRCKKKWI